MYDGFFNEDEMNGKGTFTNAVGTKINAVWKNNVI